MSSISVSYPGIPGSYSELALFEIFKQPLRITNVRTFREGFKLLETNQIDYYILPIENSSTGGIWEVFDALQYHDFYIVDETYIKICHHLLGCQDCTFQSIEQVYSHQQGFQQSIKFLNQHPNWAQIPYHNTAISAKLISELQDPRKAAIASERAAQIYNLKIVAKDIQDVSNNYTRFVVINKQLKVKSKHDKISIIYALNNNVGSLYHSLGIFAQHQINLLNLQSRPIKEMPWQVYFYLDLAGNLKDTNVKSALDHIRKESNYFKILGSYKASLKR